MYWLYWREEFGYCFNPNCCFFGNGRRGGVEVILKHVDMIANVLL